MFLNELFDRSTPVSWTKSGRNFTATFDIDGVPYVAEFSVNARAANIRSYEFMFAVDDYENDDDEFAMGTNGLGNEFQVFSTVMKIMTDFLNTQKPDEITFTGDVSANKNKLYDAMIKRMIPKLKASGYDAKINPGSKSHGYVLTKRSTTESILELFQRTADWSWLGSLGDDMHFAGFKIEGIQYVVEFIQQGQSLSKGGVWEFSFRIDKKSSTNNKVKNITGNEYENSGLGNEFIVLSTVLKILEDFIHTYSADQINFSGKNENGKSKLYDIMVKKLLSRAQTLGYEINTSNNSTSTIYSIVKKKEAKTKRTPTKKTVRPSPMIPQGSQTSESQDLTELFDRAPPVTLKRTGMGKNMVAHFEIDDHPYLVNFENSEDYNDVDDVPDIWEVSFKYDNSYKIDATKSQNGYSNTGTGNEFLVLSTVISAIRAFVKQQKPEKFYFSGSIDSEGGVANRATLYAKMIKKLASDISEYTVETYHASEYDTFMFTRKVSESQDLTELFDRSKSVGVAWKRGGHDLYANFEVDGLKYYAEFTIIDKSVLGGKWIMNYAFDIHGSSKKSASKSEYHNTQLGNEFVVLSTVVNILREFITKHQPAELSFTGDRVAGSGKTNREQLYKRMVTKLQSEISSTYDVDMASGNHGLEVTFQRRKDAPMA